MQPIFPRRNWAINNLIEFRQGKTIYAFCKYFESPEEWEKEHLDFKISHLKKLFKGLKEETNQTIHTSNKLTITTFFEDLKQIIESWNLDNVDKNDILDEVNDWNNKKYKEFLEEVSKKSNSYFNKPERTKYEHLVEYETTSLTPFSINLETIKVVNKNFYCIEDHPKLININFLDKYLEVLSKITVKFNNSISQELKLYNEGKIFADINAEKTFFDKAIDVFKNNRIIAGILLGFLIYGGISETIKYTKENKDNLFGRDGLFHKNNTKYDKIEEGASTGLKDSIGTINSIDVSPSLHENDAADSRSINPVK